MASPSAADRVSRAYAWYVVGVLLLVMAFAYLDRLAISFLIGPIQQSLALSDVQAGILLGPAFTAAFLIAAYPAGYLADRHSRRLLLGAGLLLWSLSTGLSGYAASFAALVLARAGIGLGEACIVPTVFSIVADYFPAEQRGRATSVVTIGTAVGAGASLFGGGMALAAAEGLSASTRPSMFPQTSWGLVLSGFGLLGIAMAVLLTTVREPERETGDHHGTNIPVTTQQAVFWKQLRREWRAYACILTPYVLLNYAQYALAGWLPTLLSRQQGLSPASAAMTYGSVVMISSPTAAILGGVIADRLVKRNPTGRFLLVSWFIPLFIAGIGLICLIGQSPWTEIGIGLEIFATGIILTTVYAAMTDIVPASARGQMLGVYSLLATVVGVGLGPALPALVTEYIFADQARLGDALFWSTLPACIGAMLLSIRGRRHYANLATAFAPARDKAQLTK